MKKLVLSLIALCCLAPLAAAQQDAVAPQDTAAPQNTVVEEIVARVNNAIITRNELRHNQEQSTQDAKEQHLTQDQIEERKAESLRDLIDQQLLIQKAAELGITADADLVKRLDDLRKEMKVSAMEDLQKLAESQGVSWEDFKQNTKNSILTQKVIGSEVGSHIQVTHDDLQKFYDEHKSEISQPERVRLSEILIANDPNAPKGSTAEPSPEQVAEAHAKADEIYQRLKAGASFDDLARKESSGATAADGGDLGYFKRNDLAKELEAQSFALKAGEFTPPIRTRQGFIILRVNDHIEAGTPPLDSIRDQIQEQIYAQRVQPALRQYLTKLREEAYIDVKPGYTDGGASANQTKLIYTADSGPQTKQVRGKFGMGKKKTVLVVGNEKNDHSEPAGSTSELGLAKSEVDAREKSISDRNAAEEAAAAKAAADAAEKQKMSMMTPEELTRYRAKKKREAKEQAKLAREEKHQQKEQASKQQTGKEQAGKEAVAKAGQPEPAEPKTAPAESAATAKARALAEASEKEKLNHMTPKERTKYLAKKKRQEEKDAALENKLKSKQQELAKSEVMPKAEAPKTEAPTADQPVAAAQAVPPAKPPLTPAEKSAEAKTKAAARKAAAAKAADDAAAEKEKESHMTIRERDQYRAAKRHAATEAAKQQRAEQLKRKELAKKEPAHKQEAAKSVAKTDDANSQQASSDGEAPKKKKISWF